MLKAASKASYNKLLLTQQKKAITTHHLFESPTEKYQQRRDILDTYSSVKHHVGYLKLNREHRYNTLTPNYVKNIARALESLNYDDVIKVIYMTSGKGDHFSNGTDFRTLLHYKKEGEEQKVQEYLDLLYQLQIQVSKINKPIIGVAPGHAFNSGATFLQATARPTVTLDTKIAFNEASFGFVPHGGSSYYLSRLPGEIGTFLALTGLPITGVDAKEFGIVEEVVHYSEPYEEKVANILMSMDFPTPNYNLKSNHGRWFPLHERIKKEKQSDQQKHKDDLIEVARRKHENLITEEFYEPKDNRPSTTAESDYQYKQMLANYNERYEQKRGYLETPKEANFHNYFSYILGYVKSHSGDDYYKNPHGFIKQIGMINRCFYSSTVEEIMENLKREDTNFSRLCHQKMQANSLLSMKIGLKMLREAKNLDFKGALQNELHVAMNKIQDNEFDLGVSEILLKAQKSQTPFNPGFATQVSDDQVLSYFQKNKFAADIDLKIVEKAMLPTRFYYEQFSDQVRLWVNEETTPQPDVRQYFDLELKEALRAQGIDIRDRALTIEVARAQLYERELFNRRQQAFNDRLTQIIQDPKLRERYHSQVKEQIDRLDQNTPEFYKRVNSKIQQVFENAYLSKLSTVYDKSKEAHSLDKRRMFIRFKQFLFQSRILTYSNEEVDRTLKILQNLPYKLPHLTEQWDGDKSWREMDHPELNQSFLYYFSSIVGRKNITPPELAKQYLIDPSLPKKMNLFTFNKEELLKLRRDIIENPNKYELLLRKDNGTFLTKDRLDYKFRKRDEYDYWYRVLNENRLPLDQLPFQRQMIAYGEFMDNLEMKAVATMRSTVQRLLNDFEHEEGVNEIMHYSQQEKESKHAALRRLIALVNENITEDTRTQKKAKQDDKDQVLTQKMRPVNDIKKYLNKLLDQDEQIQKILPKDETDNPLIKKFKFELLEDMYGLIEFVLLNNANKKIPKNVLQERLTSLGNPANATQKNGTNLRVIDSFLNEKNSEQLIKDAIRIVKPYFFAKIRDRLDEEADKVFDGFKAESTGNEVLFYYFMNNEYPEIQSSDIYNKIQNFNEQRDRQSYIDSMFPEESLKYGLKTLTSMIGQNIKIDKNAPIADQEYQLQEQVRKQYQNIKQIKEHIHAPELKYEAQRNQHRYEVNKKPFNVNDIDQEMENHPNYNLYNFSGADNDKILYYSEEADRMAVYIDTYSKELRQNLKPNDWLHIYANTIKAQNLDFQATLRLNLESEKFMGVDHQQQMQNLFGGNKDLNWNKLADYADFLSQLFKQGEQTFAKADSMQYHDIVSEYMIKQMDIVDPEELVKNESLYTKLKNDKALVQKYGPRNFDIKEELGAFNKLQDKVTANRKVREQIAVLADSAPLDVRERVELILGSNSDYLNLTKLEKLLIKKRYHDVQPINIIDKERLIVDISRGTIMQEWTNNYLNTHLDVVSLAQTKEVISNSSKADSTTSMFDKKLQQQVTVVLDYIDDSLKYVPNDRRQNMTLGEYLKRHHYLSVSSLEEFSNDILKNKLNELLGSQEDFQSADVIDWEYAGIRTSPQTHHLQDQRVKQALAQGKGLDSKAYLDDYLEEHTLGKGQENIENNFTQVTFVNEETGRLEEMEESEYQMENILRNAKQLTTIRQDLVPIKNYYESEMLSIYSSPDFEQTKLESLIQKYTEIRLKDCMLDSEFQKKIRSNNGHYYIKMLKEQIAEELNLSQPAKVSDFAFSKLTEDPRIKFEFEARYNLSDVSNYNALGYDNLEARIKNPEQNRDLAHETIFDKLLADYFLQKRGQYAANNELLDQLNQQFDHRAFPEGHPHKTSDPNQANKSVFPFKGEPNIYYAFALQNVQKDSIPSIKPQDYTELMELDIATQQALQNNKNGLAERLRAELPAEMRSIPDYFLLFDVRRPAHLYVDDKLTTIINEIFEVRKKVEKTLTRNELLAYDKVLINYLQKDILISKIRSEIEQDFNQLHQLGQGHQMLQEGKENDLRQGLKKTNEQGDFNKKIKNEDAYFKFYAYSGMLEKQRREEVNKTQKDCVIAMGLDTFPEFYKKQLQVDSKNEPREIDPERYQPLRGVDKRDFGQGFKTAEEREADYPREFELFQENKKEQQERNQAYYILEQFFQKAKTNTEPLDKAQDAINDYFSNPENTFFFDKNKIQ